MKKVCLSLAVLFTALFFVYLGTLIYRAILFNINCQDRLKRAADANAIEIAKAEVRVAVLYLEGKGFTKGYTSILYNTPDEDVEFFYKNLKASLNELDSIGPKATQLEKSNILMKLGETILDTGRHTTVTHPSGIFLYPYNLLFCIWGCLSFLLSAWWWLFWANIDN